MALGSICTPAWPAIAHDKIHIVVKGRGLVSNRIASLGDLQISAKRFSQAHLLRRPTLWLELPRIPNQNTDALGARRRDSQAISAD